MSRTGKERKLRIASEKNLILKEELIKRDILVEEKGRLQKELKHCTILRRNEICERIREINSVLADFNLKRMERGESITNHFRTIVGEYFPKKIVKMILEEANSRMEGNPQNKVELRIYSIEQEEILIKHYPEALEEIKNLKGKIQAAIKVMNDEVPDLKGEMDNAVYDERIARIRTISRIKKALS